MKNFTVICLILFSRLTVIAQNPDWIYIRPSNTGPGGDYYQCIRIDNCGNKWTGGYLPFWSEGSVTRFDDSVFTNWSNFEGYLPADRVYDIAFDSHGGVWVATNGLGNGVAHGGIAHYDGVAWTQYTTLNTPMPEDDMRGIYIDANDVVWATFKNTASGTGGIVKFDGNTWTVYTTANSTLPNDYVDKIMGDHLGNIWIGTDYGLIKYDGNTFTLLTSQNSGLTSIKVRDVEFDRTTNKLYVSTGNAIDIWDGSVWTHIDNTNSPVHWSGLWAVDARGDSVIITTVGGSYLTYIYDGINWITHPENDHTYDARIDADGNFWTAGIGAIEKFDGVNWTHYDQMNSGLTTMFNNDVFVDSKNRAWFASSSNGGINLFDCPKWQAYNPYNYNLWPSPVSYTGSGTGITEDKFGNIWMTYSGVSGAVVKVDGGDVNNPVAWHVWDNANSGISLQFLNRVAADTSGNVWVGYDGACSVSKYTHATNSWTNYNLFQMGQTSCGSGSGINSIRVDDSNHVWICGDAGVVKYDQQNWTFYSSQNTSMLPGYAFDIAFDSSGNKWVATENGLYLFDNNTWTLFNSSNTPMVGNNAKSVTVDHDNVVWVGSSDPVFPYPGSLCSYDGAVWTAYTPANSGLPENFVNRLEVDTLGNLWVLTDTKGAALFNPGGVIGYDCIDKSLMNCTVTGIDDVSMINDELLIYPQPVTGESRIQLESAISENGNAIFFDMTGKELYSIKLFPGQIKITLQEIVNNLPPGLYICEIQDGLKRMNSKFVKM